MVLGSVKWTLCIAQGRSVPTLNAQSCNPQSHPAVVAAVLSSVESISDLLASSFEDMCFIIRGAVEGPQPTGNSTLLKACSHLHTQCALIRINAHWLRSHCKWIESMRIQTGLISIHLLRWFETSLKWIGVDWWCGL